MRKQRHSWRATPESPLTDLKSTTILMPVPMMPMIQEGLTSAFTLLKAWEQTDPESFMAVHAGAVRGIAAGFAKRFDAPFLSRFPKLEIVSNFGVGYDSVDAAWCGQNRILVTNTPDVLTDEVADLTIGLLLATVRQLPQADAYVRRGAWLQAPFPLSATLRGRRIGIIGLGRIGKAIAARLEGFGVSIAYHGRGAQPDVSYAYHATLTGLAEAVDVLISVAPGSASTHHMIDAEVLAALGPEGILINVGRGSVVDEVALIAALKAGTILTAGLDVFEDEPRVPQGLIDMPHVVLLPHVGSASHHTRRMMGQLVVDNLISWFAKGQPVTPVAETPWTIG
jgi:lactate dehydrogenase-like 2-hydroxyacid dehydrogenase